MINNIVDDISNEERSKERDEERRQVRVANVPRKINDGKNKGRYELDIVPIHIEEDGKIIEGDMETIIVPKEIIMEMMDQAREFFDGKVKEDDNRKVMYG